MSLTNEEYFKLNGTLSNCRIERLLDIEHKSHVSTDEIISTGDISAGFPVEDCLSEIFDMLRKVKLTKKDHQLLVDLVDEIQTQLWQSAEYGMSELKQLEIELDKVRK